MNPRPVIIGVGNILMGDDGVGPAAVDLLRRRGLAGRADLLDAGLAFSDVLCDIDPDRRLIVIDAVRGAGRPGTVYRLDPDDADDRDDSPVSLHEVSVVPALRLAALAGREFTDVTVFGVEPARLAWGEGLSPPVAGALDALAVEIEAHLARPAEAGRRPAGSPQP